jgi:peptidoglycan/LPS O-acetylase OafA/YrhL
MKKQEIYSLTGLRGVAAIVVMFYHFNASSLLSGTGATVLGYGYLMVDLFLILSGFIIAMMYGQQFEQSVTWKNYTQFLVRRIARIYPLYALMTLSAGALIAIGWMDRWPGPDISISALINLTMLQAVLQVPSLDTPAWSVSAEWVANLLFPVLALLCLRRSWLWICLMAIISFVTLPILIGLPALIDEPKRAGLLDIWHYDTVYPVVRCVADFTLGIIIFRVSKLSWVKRLTSLSWLSPVLLCLILIFMSIQQADVWIVALFPLFILSLVPDNNLVARFIGCRPIYKLGELSYAIYLIHNQMNYFILYFAKKLESIGIDKLSANAFSMFLFSVFVIFLANLAYRFIEKPARSQINSLAARKPSPVYEAA